MCPLIAPTGSPWTNEKGGECPENARICPWWNISCATGELHYVVAEAAAGRPIPVVGPNRPSSYKVDEKKIGRTFDCPKEGHCSWQKQALLKGHPLCPPREALKKGLDPRVVNF